MPLFSRKSREPERPPVPFIVGVGRSGTTMLRLMLDAHPDLAIPPETHFVPTLIDAIAAGASPEQAAETMTAVRQWGDLHTDAADVVARWEGLDRFAPADGAFYLYADVGHLTADSHALCAQILEHTGVALTPGADFDSDRGHRYLRIAFAGEPDRVITGARRLADWLSSAR